MAIRPFAVVSSALVAVAGLSSVASAGVVATLNANPANYTFSETRGLVRYRVSQTNWDQIIATSSNITPSTIVQQANLGNNNQLQGTPFNFNLTHTVGVGYSWTLTNTITNAVSTVNWTAPHNGSSPTQPVNAIRFYTQAGGTLPGGVASASFSATNLAFTGATTVGSLVNLSQSWVANTTNGEPPSQLIVADGDLTTFSWSFTGTVVANWTYLPGFTAPQGNLDERLKLDIKLTNATLIPAPGAGLALVMGGLVAARRRRSIR
jgi:hypothetical protein